MFISLNVDLRVLRLFSKEAPFDQSVEPLNDIFYEKTDTDMAQPSCIWTTANAAPSVDLLLLVFIRYLQLIRLVAWSSPMSLTYGSTATPPHSAMNDSLQVSFENRFEPGLCGLTNIGNTCFMNSAIQCLSNIPQLTEWAKTQLISKRKKSVAQAYASLIQSMWSGDNSCVTPRTIKQRVSQYAPIFSDFAQKDSHEFMNSLLNALHSELAANDSLEEQSSIVTDLFRICTESVVTCLQCGTHESTEETTYCLPLPLGEDEQVSLTMLVNDFTKEEQLDGQYYCSHCQDLRQAKQKTSISCPLPPVIIVQLKRFSFDGTDAKLNTLVHYPVVNWKVLENDASTYNLIGVSMHVGNLKRGHYTANARLNGSGRWYHFNDSFFTPVDDSDCLVNRDAYVLIYLKNN